MSQQPDGQEEVEREKLRLIRENSQRDDAEVDGCFLQIGVASALFVLGLMVLMGIASMDD